MELDERDRTGQPFVSDTDLLESVVEVGIGVLVIYDQLPVMDMLVPAGDA
jgi:hypothetical protein